MSSELSTAPVNPGFHKATSQLATTLGIEPRMMIDTLKKQCFPSMRAEDVSDAQLAAFISVANTMELNPLIPGMLYAYPGKNGGIVPVSGPDGVLKKLDESIEKQKLDGYECVVYPEDVNQPPTHAIAKIWRKGSERPAMFTAIFKEWIVQSNANWQMRPRHMLWLRAIKQCARQVIHGVPFDEDDLKIGDMVNVTPEEKKATDRPLPPTRAPKGVNATTPTTTEAEIIPAKNVTPPQNTATPPPAENKETAPEPKTDHRPDPKPKPEPKSATPAEPPKTVAPAAPAPANPPGEAPKKPRTTPLIDKEEMVAICTPEKVFAMIVNVAGQPTPSIQAAVTGDYVGGVFHFGGAVKNGDAIEPGPTWVVGKKLKLNLAGKLNQKNKQLMCVVNSVEVVEAGSETQNMDVD